MLDWMVKVTKIRLITVKVHELVLGRKTNHVNSNNVYNISCTTEQVEFAALLNQFFKHSQQVFSKMIEKHFCHHVFSPFSIILIFQILIWKYFHVSCLMDDGWGLLITLSWIGPCINAISKMIHHHITFIYNINSVWHSVYSL